MDVVSQLPCQTGFPAFSLNISQVRPRHSICGDGYCPRGCLFRLHPIPARPATKSFAFVSLHRYQFYGHDLVHPVREALRLTGGGAVAVRIHGQVHDHVHVLIHGVINGYSQFRVEPGDTRRIAACNGYAHPGRTCIGIGRGF